MSSAAHVHGHCYQLEINYFVTANESSRCVPLRARICTLLATIINLTIDPLGYQLMNTTFSYSASTLIYRALLYPYLMRNGISVVTLETLDSAGVRGKERETRFQA